MHFTLRISQFPVTQVERILKKSIPAAPLLVYTNLSEMLRCEPSNPFRGFVSMDLPVVNHPVAYQFCLMRLEVHKGFFLDDISGGGLIVYATIERALRTENSKRSAYFVTMCRASGAGFWHNLQP